MSDDRVDDTVLATFYGDDEFPVQWQEGQKELFWVHDDLHIPNPISPMYADLHDLPPMLLTVGTADWLLDDSLFFAARLRAAGNRVELAVYPEAPHGIDGAPTKMGEVCRERMYDFLRGCLATA